MLEKDIIMF